MNDDSIDILMATYRGEKYLRAQLESILAQSYQNFRIIICDDHSQDGTKKIIQEYKEQYPEKIIEVFSEKNLGAKGNFSYLMSHAKAPYVMFSDQDDIWLKDKILNTFNEMKRLELEHGKDQPLLVHTDLKVVDQDLSILDESFWNYAHLKAFRFRTINRLMIQNVVTGCTMMINQPLLILSSPIPEGSLMHDWWIALVASTFGEIGILNQSTILYRQHGSNTLGAKKFGTVTFFLDAFKKFVTKDRSFQDQVNKRLHQVELFLNRYFKMLSPKNKEIIQAYLELSSYSWWKKRYVVIKYKLFRSGFLRNFLTFFVKLQP